MGYTQTSGTGAEELACRYLQNQGMNLIQRNFNTRYGEIDLIMRDGDTTVFVEVRFRAQNNLVDPLSSIDWRKQQKLIRTANSWLQKNGDTATTAARFDVIAVSGATPEYKIDWIRNAFDSGST